MRIKQIEYGGENHSVWDLGARHPRYGKVIEIVEHRPQGDGDRWYYDVNFERGTQRIFNPNDVFFEKDHY